MKRCKACEKELVPAPTRKDVGGKTFCNVNCQHDWQSAKLRRDFIEGNYAGQHMGFPAGSWTRSVLIELFGYECNSCGIFEWNGQQITLEVNHKDGVANNNLIGNLEFLCPNCHSQTPTFRAKNKCSTRTFRKKLAE